jgi:hypothetical protein
MLCGGAFLKRGIPKTLDFNTQIVYFWMITGGTPFVGKRNPPGNTVVDDPTESDLKPGLITG